VTVGFFAFILPLSVGPVFAVFSWRVIGYELMTSYPRGRAARREQLIGEQLPLCLELLGQRMSSGEPVETAVMSMAQDLSAGPLADEMKLVMESVQTGMPVCDALLELPKRIRGGEIRAIVAALHTFAFGEFQSGQALVNYSQFMRTHRSIVTKMSRRVAVIRRMFAVALVVAIFLALGMDPLLPQGMIGLSLASLEMLRELGAMLVLVAVLMVGRMTGSQWWDGAHGE
jgi:Flp pilus assembly protein TadB